MEREEWAIGPFCTDTSCTIPYGVEVGRFDSPVAVSIFFHVGIVSAINVRFNSIYWNDFLPILDQKYGADWDIERTNQRVLNWETKETEVVEQVRMNHKTEGTNPTTQDHCEISAASVDGWFTHQDAHGPYQSIFAIELISKNF